MVQPTQKEFIQGVAEALTFPESDEFDNAVEELRGVPPQGLKELFTELLDDPDAGLALGATRAIGALRLSDAVDLLIGLVDEPGKWFGRTERAAIRLAAVESLGLLAKGKAIDVLLDLLETSQDDELNSEAVRALGRIKSPLCVRRLLDAMKANPPIALSAAGALAQIGGETAFRGLVAGLVHDDEMVRSASVWALGEMGDERAVGPLIKLGGQADPLIRRDIAWTLGRIGGIQARLALGAAVQKDPDLGVRREASRAIRAGAVLGGKRTEGMD